MKSDSGNGQVVTGSAGGSYGGQTGGDADAAAPGGPGAGGGPDVVDGPEVAGGPAESHPGRHRDPRQSANAGSPPAAAGAEIGAEIMVELQAVRDALSVLAHREQERAAHREAVIDRLHAENQTLRRQEIEVMLEPVRMGLYRLYDIACREADRWSGAARPPAEHAGPLLTVIAEEISEVLARTGVEPFTARYGEPFNPLRHRPVDTEVVSDPVLDGAVTRTVNDGFARGAEVARRADVVVGRLAGPGTTPHQDI